MLLSPLRPAGRTNRAYKTGVRVRTAIHRKIAQVCPYNNACKSRRRKPVSTSSCQTRSHPIHTPPVYLPPTDLPARLRDEIISSLFFSRGFFLLLVLVRNSEIDATRNERRRTENRNNFKFFRPIWYQDRRPGPPTLAPGLLNVIIQKDRLRVDGSILRVKIAGRNGGRFFGDNFQDLRQNKFKKKLFRSLVWGSVRKAIPTVLRWKYTAAVPCGDHRHTVNVTFFRRTNYITYKRRKFRPVLETDPRIPSFTRTHFLRFKSDFNLFVYF